MMKDESDQRNNKIAQESIYCNRRLFNFLNEFTKRNAQTAEWGFQPLEIRKTVDNLLHLPLSHSLESLSCLRSRLYVPLPEVCSPTYTIAERYRICQGQTKFLNIIGRRI
jgi:hypothetical protein